MKFKVGDRVAIYDLDRNLENMRVVATITDVLAGGQLYTDHIPHDGLDASMVHPKQCRLLKKKKSKVIWVPKFWHEIDCDALKRQGVDWLSVEPSENSKEDFVRYVQKDEKK